MKFEKFLKKYAEIKASLITEDVEDILSSLLKVKSLDSLKKDNKNLIDEFKSLDIEKSDEVLEKMLMKIANDKNKESSLNQIYLFLKEINEKKYQRS